VPRDCHPLPPLPGSQWQWLAMAGNGSFFWSDLRGFSGFSLPRILSFVREWQSVVFLYWLPHAPNCHPLPPFYLYWQQYRAVAGSVSCFLILSKLLRLLRYEILSKLGEILRIVVCDLWSMVDGRWSMVDGRWSMVDGRWSMVCGDCSGFRHCHSGPIAKDCRESLDAHGRTDQAPSGPPSRTGSALDLANPAPPSSCPRIAGQASSSAAGSVPLNPGKLDPTTRHPPPPPQPRRLRRGRPNKNFPHTERTGVGTC